MSYMVIPAPLDYGYQKWSLMRRIIERIVTVVTTTTWKISWEPDTSPPNQAMGTELVDLSSLEHLPSASSNTNLYSQENEGTDVDQTEEEKFDELPEDKPKSEIC